MCLIQFRWLATRAQQITLTVLWQVNVNVLVVQLHVRLIHKQTIVNVRQLMELWWVILKLLTNVFVRLIYHCGMGNIVSLAQQRLNTILKKNNAIIALKDLLGIRLHTPVFLGFDFLIFLYYNINFPYLPFILWYWKSLQ